MKAITIRKHDDTTITFDIPKGCNGQMCLRALRVANSGGSILGLTDSEAEFVADMVAELQQDQEVTA